MRALLTIAACALGAALLLAAPAVGGDTPSVQVVVPRGQPVQIAVVLDRSSTVGAPFEQGIRNAIQMAVELNPSIRGFPIQLNGGFDGPCAAAPDVVAQNAAAATAVVGNMQNVAVIGHMCSFPFAGCPSPAPTTALSIYEESGVVAINGSTTDPCLPSVGPTVFDRTAVADPSFDAWYATVKTLPTDRLWRAVYRFEFGTPAPDFADLYFDATRLLLSRIEQVSRVVSGNLVIGRAALAQAVRATRSFPGVTCSITLDPATGNRLADATALARCAP